MRLAESAQIQVALTGTHIHHIKHWAVYKSHDDKHMIAICPSCHDAVHGGSGISDEILYEWKQIPRDNARIQTHFYVEPANQIRVLTGSMSVTTANTEGIVFKLSNLNELKFKILDGEIFLASCLIRDLSGSTLVRIVENYVTIKNDRIIEIERRPGRIRVTMLDAKKYVPPWTLSIMWRALPEFMDGNRTTILDLDVKKPGTVRLQGVFVAKDCVLAITEAKIWVLRPEMNGPVAFVGQGEGTEIKITGPMTRAAWQL